jgi:hypothetical protein
MYPFPSRSNTLKASRISVEKWRNKTQIGGLRLVWCTNALIMGCSDFPTTQHSCSDLSNYPQITVNKAQT